MYVNHVEFQTYTWKEFLNFSVKTHGPVKQGNLQKQGENRPKRRLPATSMPLTCCVVPGMPLLAMAVFYSIETRWADGSTRVGRGSDGLAQTPGLQ